MRYTWLVTAATLTALGCGDRPVEIAGWLAPVFLLRFTRGGGFLRGYLPATAALVAALFLGYRHMTPAPLAVFVVSVIIGAAIELLPYLLDRWLNRHLGRFAATLTLPTAMVAIAWFTSRGDSGSMGSIAYLSSESLSQFVSITGLWGLVFLPFWFASVLNLAWDRWEHPREWRRPIVAMVLVFGAIYGYGAIRLRTVDATGTVRVAGIILSPAQREVIWQACEPIFAGREFTPAELKVFQRVSGDVAADLVVRSAKQAAAGAEIVVWSEAAAICMLADEPKIIEAARRTARQQGIFLGITLAIADPGFVALRESGQPFLRNKLVMIAPSGDVAWEYTKTKLVPGMPESLAFVPGDGTLHRVDTPFGPLSGAICYDLDFPSLIRSAGRARTAVLVAPSNDWAQIRHTHARVARFRAIENGVALLRPTSNGLSIAVDPMGRIVGRVDYFTSQGAPLVAELPVSPVRTIYATIGDLFAYVCVAGTVAIVIAGLVRRGRQERESVEAA